VIVHCSNKECGVKFQRIGTAYGIGTDGEQQHVVVYRDGDGFKLSGRGGSHLVNSPALETALREVASRYRLQNVEYESSWRRN